MQQVGCDPAEFDQLRLGDLRRHPARAVTKMMTIAKLLPIAFPQDGGPNGLWVCGVRRRDEAVVDVARWGLSQLRVVPQPCSKILSGCAHGFARLFLFIV